MWLSLSIISFVVVIGSILFLGLTVINTAKNTWNKAIDSIENYESDLSDSRKYLIDEDYPNEQILLLQSFEADSLKAMVPDKFYTNFGFRDYYRYPLVYPYALECVDDTEFGYLIIDNTDSIIPNIQKDEINSHLGTLLHISRFSFDQNYLVYISDTLEFPEYMGNGKYTLFTFSDQSTDVLYDEEELNKKLDEIAFKGSRDFITISEYDMLFY
jgi:hypothetical protein